MRRKYSKVLTRIFFIFSLFFGCCLNQSLAQSIPALTFEIKKPQKLENKKLGSERNADKKFTFPRRIIQNTYTHFNWEFNAREKLNEIIERARMAHRDDYNQLLSFYNYSLDNTIRDSIELDSVIWKANAGILLHDLRNDWVDNLYMLMGKAYYMRQVFDTAYLTFQYINYAFSPKESDGYDIPIGSNATEGGNAFSISTPEKRNIVKKVFTQPPSRNESFLWLIRTYITVGEYPEAAGMIETLKHDPRFPERLQGELNEMQALWFYNQQMFDSAAFYLEKALPSADGREEKARWEYLIGQLYEASRQPTKAQEFYERSVKHTLNPILEVYGRLNSIRQNRGDEKAIQENLDQLMKMARKDRYTNYRDIIYYSAAQIELERNNTAAAKVLLLKSTKAAIDKSADRNQKSRSFLLLGDLSYKEAAYIDAKNYYDSVLNTEVVSNIDTFNQRKSVLGKIFEYASVIQRQDSLQKIAAMTEAERDAYIKKLVKKLRKQQGLKEEEPSSGNSNTPNPNNTAPVDLFDNTKGDWYFYNTSLKSKGYTDFRGKWGTRPNVDNWRRVAAVDKAIQQKINAGDNKGTNSSSEPDDGVISFETLLGKLPITPEKKQKSNDSIETAQIELGKALMEGLEDYPAAIHELDAFAQKFQYSSRRPEALRYLYYCYLKVGSSDRANLIKTELQQRYKGSEEEKIVSNPVKKDKNDKQKEVMDRAYDRIYNLFIEGKFDEALAEKKKADSLFSKNYWTAQLLYIQSIYYIHQRQDDSAKSTLQDIINVFPSSQLAIRAQNIINVLGRRKEIEDYLTNLKIERPTEDSVIIVDDKPARTQPVNPGNKPAVSGNNKSDSALVKTVPPAPVTNPGVKRDSTQNKPSVPLKVAYTHNPAIPHYVLLIVTKVDGVFVTETKNAFNRYNKQNFYNKQIDISSEIIDDSSRIVLMAGFENAEAALTYVEKIRKIAATEIIPWLPVEKYTYGVISGPNLEILKSSKDIVEYRKFLAGYFPGKF